MPGPERRYGWTSAIPGIQRAIPAIQSWLDYWAAFAPLSSAIPRTDRHSDRRKSCLPFLVRRHDSWPTRRCRNKRPVPRPRARHTGSRGRAAADRPPSRRRAAAFAASEYSRLLALAGAPVGDRSCQQGLRSGAANDPTASREVAPSQPRNIHRQRTFASGPLVTRIRQLTWRSSARSTIPRGAWQFLSSERGLREISPPPPHGIVTRAGSVNPLGLG